MYSAPGGRGLPARARGGGAIPVQAQYATGGGGKGYTPGGGGRHVSHAQLQSEAESLMVEEAEKGHYVEVGLIASRLCELHERNDYASFRMGYPQDLPPLRKLYHRGAKVMMLINVYKKTTQMGSLFDCLRYIVRQMNALCDGKYDTFDGVDYYDLGLGPFHAHPELLRHYPGIASLGGGPPPQVGASDFIGAVCNRMRQRRGGKLQLEDIIEDVMEAHGGKSAEELCIFVTNISLGLLIQTTSGSLRESQENMRVLAIEHERKVVAQYREDRLGVTEEELLEIDDDIEGSLQCVADLSELIMDKAKPLIEEAGLSDMEVKRFLSTYLLRYLREENHCGARLTTLGAAYLHSIIQLMHAEDAVCRKCNTFFDLCKRCFSEDPDELLLDGAPVVVAGDGGKAVTRATRSAPGGQAEGAEAFDESDVLGFIAAVLSEAVCLDAQVGGGEAAAHAHSIVARLLSIEMLACERADVGSFAEFGCGSFTDFFARHGRRFVESLPADDSAAQVEVSSDASVQQFIKQIAADAQATSSTVSSARPELSDVLDAVIEEVRKRTPFVQSWGLLQALEMVVPIKFKKTNWHDICESPFTVFMGRNTKTLEKQGYVLVGSGVGVSEVRRTSRTAPGMPRSLVAALLHGVGGGALEGEEQAEAVQHAVRAYTCGAAADVQGLCEAKTLECISAEVGVAQAAALRDVFVFAGAEGGSGRTLREELELGERARGGLAEAFGVSVMGLIREAAVAPNGVDLCSLLLYNELYRRGADGTETSMGEYLVAREEELREAGVRILAAAGDRPYEEPKYYLVHTGADAAAVEAAACSGSFYETGVLVWSLLVGATLDELSQEGPRGSTLKRVMQALRDAFERAHAEHTLPSAVAQLLLATPAPLVAEAFCELYTPALDSVDGQWREKAAALVSMHSQKAVLMQKATRVPALAAAWMASYRGTLDKCAKHTQEVQTVVVRQAVPAAAVPPVDKKAKVEEAVAIEPAKQDDATPEAEDTAAAGDEEALLLAIRDRLSPGGGDNALTHMMKRTLGVIADQLYESEFHFFFELVQNADDNQYGEGTEPALRLYLDPAGVEILNNEAGFQRANVEAVCKVNESTKIGSASIGRKGIGFKAVFSVTDCPHITSNGYNFSFDRNSCDLGLVKPVVERQVPVPSSGKLVQHGGAVLEDGEWVTRLYLPFKPHYVGDAKFYDACGTGVDGVQSLLLLFLNRLRRIEVENRLRNVRRVLVREDTAVDAALAATVPLPVPEEGAEPQASVCIRSLAEVVGTQPVSRETFLVYERKLAITDTAAKRARYGQQGDASDAEVEAQPTTVQVAFLAAEDASVQTTIEGVARMHTDDGADGANTGAVPIFPMTAYLPTNTKLFRFVVQADWTVNAARDRVVESNAWNVAIRSELRGILLEAFRVVACCTSEGRLVADYLYQMIPDEPPRDDWMRGVVRGLHQDLRHFPCVRALAPDTAEGWAWVEPVQSVLLPEGPAGELVLELLPPDQLLALVGRRYADPAILRCGERNHRDLLRLRLGVEEFSAEMLIVALEKMVAGGSLPQDLGWISRCLFALKLLVAQAGSAATAAVLQRFRKIRMVPVSRASDASDAPGTDGPSVAFVSVEEGDLYITPGKGYAFFRFLNIVDPRLLERKDDGAAEKGARTFLLKAGVKSTGVTEVLESMEGIFDQWDAAGDGQLEVQLDDVLSCARWLQTNDGRLRGAVPELLLSVLRRLPVGCATLPAAALEVHTRHSTNPERAVLRQLGNSVLVRPEYVDVVHGKKSHDSPLLRLAREANVPWLTVHPAYAQGEHGYPTDLLERVGVSPGVVRIRRVPHRDVAAGAWQTAVQELREARIANGATIMGATSTTGVPKVPDTDKRMAAHLVQDAVAPGVEVVLEVLGKAAQGKCTRLHEEASAQLLYELLDDRHRIQDHLSCTLSYVPDLSSVGGRVATEDDRTEAGGYPTTLHLMLARSAWVAGMDKQLRIPDSLYFVTDDVESVLGPQERAVSYGGMLAQFGDRRLRAAVCGVAVLAEESVASELLQQLGVQASVSDERLAYEVTGWVRQKEFISSGEHMARVLKRIGGARFPKIWVPEDRKPPVRGQEGVPVKGLWYSPDVCFVKGGTDALLDWASSQLRFVGFVYKRCGRELGDAGVREHAPWEDQLRCLATIAKQRTKLSSYSRSGLDLIASVGDHLRNMLKYADEFTEEGKEALRTADVWYTVRGTFVSLSSKQTVLYNDKRTVTSDLLRKLPKQYAVISEEMYLNDRDLVFLQPLGMQLLSGVVKESRKAPDARIAWGLRAVLDYTWRALARALVAALEDLEDEEALAEVRERAVLTDGFAVKYVQHIVIGYAVEGSDVELDTARAKPHPYFYDGARRVLMVATQADGRDLSYAELVQRLTDALQAQFPVLEGKRMFDDSFKRSCAMFQGLAFVPSRARPDGADSDSDGDDVLDSAVDDDVAARFVKEASLPVVAGVLEVHHKSRAGRHGRGDVALLDPQRVRMVHDFHDIKPDETLRTSLGNSKQHVYGWLAQRLAEETCIRGSAELGTETRDAFAQFFRNTEFLQMEGVVHEKAVVGDVSLGQRLRQSAVSPPAGTGAKWVCRFSTPSTPGDTATVVASIVEDAATHVFARLTAEMTVERAVPAYLAFLEAAETAGGAVKSACDQRLSSTSTRIADVLFDFKAVAKQGGWPESLTTVPPALRAIYDNEDKEIQVRKEKLAEARAKADEAKEKAKEPRASRSFDPAAATPTFGAGPSRPVDGANQGLSSTVTPELLEAAKERRKNWDTLVVPDDTTFLNVPDYLGDKEGFKYENGPQGLGYYREGSRPNQPLPEGEKKDAPVVPTTFLPSDSDDEDTSDKLPVVAAPLPSARPAAPTAPAAPGTSAAPEGPPSDGVQVTVAEGVAEGAQPAEGAPVRTTVLGAVDGEIRLKQRAPGAAVYIRADASKSDDRRIGELGEQHVYRHLLQEVEEDPHEQDNREWSDPNRKLVHWLNSTEETYLPCDIIRGVPLEVFTAVFQLPRAEQADGLVQVSRDYPWFEVLEVKTSLHDKPVMEMAVKELEMARILKTRFALYQLSCVASGQPVLKRFYDPLDYAEKGVLKLLLALNVDNVGSVDIDAKAVTDYFADAVREAADESA